MTSKLLFSCIFVILCSCSNTVEPDSTTSSQTPNAVTSSAITQSSATASASIPTTPISTTASSKTNSSIVGIWSLDSRPLLLLNLKNDNSYITIHINETLEEGTWSVKDDLLTTVKKNCSSVCTTSIKYKSNGSTLTLTNPVSGLTAPYTKQ